MLELGSGGRFFATVLDGAPRAGLGSGGGGSVTFGNTTYTHLPSTDPPPAIHTRDFWYCGGCGYDNLLTRRTCRRCNQDRPARPRVVSRDWHREPPVARQGTRGGPIGSGGARPMLGSWGTAAARTVGMDVGDATASPTRSRQNAEGTLQGAEAFPPLPRGGANLQPEYPRTSHHPQQLRQQLHQSAPWRNKQQDGEWELGGLSRAQRRNYRRKQSRAENQATNKAGDGQEERKVELGEDDMQDVQDTPGLDDRTKEPAQFEAPGKSREICNLRAQLLRTRVAEMERQGVEDQRIAKARESLQDAVKRVKAAGGVSSRNLRNEVLGEQRKLAKREAAVARAAKQKIQLEKDVSDAVSKLEAHTKEEEDLAARLEYSKKRYAYLLAQQAAESQPIGYADRVQQALREFEALPEAQQALRGALDIIKDAVAAYFPGKKAVGEDVLGEAWLDSDPSDEEIPNEGDDDNDNDFDDEHEVTATMLEEERKAKNEVRELRRQRNRRVVESFGAGLPVDGIVDAMVDKIEAAIDRHKAAEKAIEEAKSKASERRRRRKQEEEASAAAAVAATAAARRRGATEHDDEVIPCPPTKWRRADDDDGNASETTVDETPCISVPPGGKPCGAARPSVVPRGTGSLPQATHEQQQKQQQQQQAGHHQTQRDDSGAEALGDPSGQSQSSRTGAGLEAALADGAVGAAAAAQRSATRELERRRSQRRSASLDKVSVGREDRSKSPRRVPRTSMEAE